MQKKQTWYVGIGGSDSDCVVMYKVIGTKAEIKRYLVGLVKKDKNESPDDWDWGTEKVSDLEIMASGEINASACFDNWHNDYSACPEEYLNKRRCVVL